MIDSAAKLIVATLAANRVDRVFCVPGESYLPLLDALHRHPTIDLVTCRHEAGAGFMAVADARLSGRPGVVLVSRGPGASNAAIAVHTAQQDATPFLLLVGQVERKDLRRGAFQEIDYGAMYGSIAKWTAEVRDPVQLPEILQRGLAVATTGVPGPVVIALPEDLLEATGAYAAPRAPAAIGSAAPQDAARELETALAGAARPLAIAGHGLEGPGGREALLDFAERFACPVAVSFRRHDLFPNDHPLYAGDLGLSNPAPQMEAFHSADLVLALGTRLGDITTQGYSFPVLPRPRQPLVHVCADPAVLGTHYAADLALACAVPVLLRALVPAAPPPSERSAWAERLVGLRRKIAARVEDPAMDRLAREIAARLEPDAIVTADAGSFARPLYRSIPYRPPQRLLAPISGAMGFGIPAAVAAALRHPGRQVVAFVGDGGFLMTGSELAVALERRLRLTVVLSNNGSYGSIRIHQQRRYPGRIAGTDLVNPDFRKIAEAYSCAYHRVDGALPAAAPGDGLTFLELAHPPD
jgi:acetolactate synthase-1/2/3 large subunit